MKTIITAAIGVALMAGTANATPKNVNTQGQHQGQAQGQFQGQGQHQGVDNRDNFQFSQSYESRPSGPSIAAGLAGLPSFSNSGLMNACAGAEAWTFSIGGSVGLAGGQISGAGGLIGFGDSKVVTIVPCEIREAVVLLGEAGVDKAATAVACLHPYMKIGLEAETPGICGGVPNAPPAIKTTAGNPPIGSRTQASASSPGADYAYLD